MSRGLPACLASDSVAVRPVHFMLRATCLFSRPCSIDIRKHLSFLRCEAYSPFETILKACFLMRRVLQIARKGLLESARNCLFLEQTSEVMLIALDPAHFHTRWRILSDSISDLHRSWEDVEAHCFKHLVIHTSQVINFNFTACALDTPSFFLCTACAGYCVSL